MIPPWDMQGGNAFALSFDIHFVSDINISSFLLEMFCPLEIIQQDLIIYQDS